MSGIELLFLWDVNPEVKDGAKRTPLVLSAIMDDVECTRLLLTHNASTENINIEEFGGKHVYALLREGATTVTEPAVIRKNKVFEEVKEIKELFENLSPRRKPKKKYKSPLRGLLNPTIEAESQSLPSPVTHSEDDKSSVSKIQYGKSASHVVRGTYSETDCPSETYSFERTSTNEKRSENWIPRDAIVRSSPINSITTYAPINVLYTEVSFPNHLEEPPPSTTVQAVRKQIPHLSIQRQKDNHSG